MTPFLRKLRWLPMRRRKEDELQEELRFHLEEEAAERLARGIGAEDAGRAAQRDLGNIALVRENTRDAWGWVWLEQLVRDVRFGARVLRKNAGFTGIAVTILALGIGINAIVFAVTSATLFKGFPLVRRNDRIVYITSSRGCCVSYPDFMDWRAQAKSFEGMAIVHGVAVTLSDRSGFPERYDATEVSAGTFRLAGAEPVLGRDFAAADEAPGAAPVAILSYSFWDRRFGKDPAIVGRTIRMNGIPTAVIGVMPQGFTFPQKEDLWVPLVQSPALFKRENHDTWFVFGRLADGATIGSARAEMQNIGRRLASAYPATNKGSLPILCTFGEFFIGPDAILMYRAMWAAVGFVLLIACANLANLMLARAMGRSREISVRMAMGAGRWRIVRQLLIESVMLSGMGGFFGWWIAAWGVRIYAAAAAGSGIVSDQIAGDWFDHVLDYSMDYRVFAYLAAISIGTGVLFGLAPAARLSKLDVNASLKDGGRGATGGVFARHLSALLVIAEMALAVTLLAGAGVMVRSFLNVYAVDLGFNKENILTALVSLPDARYHSAEAQISFYDRLHKGLEAVPGMESAVVTDALPGLRPWPQEYELADAPAEEGPRLPTVPRVVIGPSFFHLLGTPVLAGREFNQFDGASGVQVAVVNQRFASAVWPGQNPIGKRLRFFSRIAPLQWLTVVGVVANIGQNDRKREEFEPRVYLPFAQKPSRAMWVMARTRARPGGLATAFRAAVQKLDSDLPVTLGPVPLTDRLASGYQYRGFVAVLFLVFAVIALLLASVGLYAVSAYSVSRRTQEIGIRMAIGGTARDIRNLLIRRSMFEVGAGLIAGVAAALALTPLLKSVLVQVSPADPVTFVVASVVLIVAAGLGSVIPARRAMSVDPVVALRHD